MLKGTKNVSKDTEVPIITSDILTIIIEDKNNAEYVFILFYNGY